MSGSSGLIGTALAQKCSESGFPVIRLVRKPSQHPLDVAWNPDSPQPISDCSCLENAFAAIHLSGASLFRHRWSPAFKRQIYASRVHTTRFLVDQLKKLKSPPACLLCASAIGIYGDRGEETLTESSRSGQGFLPDVCRGWEVEANRAAEAGIRVVNLRFGVVLAREGGALRQTLPLFRFGLGGRLGSGSQWMSWIALSDLEKAVMHILKTDAIRGPVNLVSPIPVTNREFTWALGHVLHRPAVLPVPAFALRLAFGELADSTLLASTRVIPERLAASHFHFDHIEINDALKSIL
jgi:hypothetical protein